MIDEEEEVFYALILERNSPKPVSEIGRIVARNLEQPTPDAVAQVRYGGGLIAEALSASEARSIADALRDIDVKTRLVTAEDWLTLPRGYKISSLVFGDGALEACLSSGRKFVLPRADLYGLHLYGLCPEATETQATRTRSEGASLELRGLSSLSDLSPRGRRLLAGLEENEITGMEMHLTLYGPPSIGPMRIRRVEFNFSCLGDSKSGHSLDNFLQLLERLAEFLPHAWNVERVREFLDDADPTRILYFKKEEAENFDRWMLQWVAIEAAAREERAKAGE